MNKLEAAFSNSIIEEGTVSEEDEAADCKENGQKGKSKVCHVLVTELINKSYLGFSKQN